VALRKGTHGDCKFTGFITESQCWGKKTLIFTCTLLAHRRKCLIYNGAGEGNRILSENVHNSLNCPIIVHCKRHIFHHLRIKRHGDDQTLMQIDASASVISRPCALVRSYHNPANLRVKTEILSAHRKVVL
jgi:hypothetical protein